eukprot:8571249-Ditylum_brightwellii.AAC.1
MRSPLPAARPHRSPARAGRAARRRRSTRRSPAGSGVLGGCCDARLRMRGHVDETRAGQERPCLMGARI